MGFGLVGNRKMDNIFARCAILPFIIITLSVTGCASQGGSRKAAVAPGAVAELRGSNSDIEMQVLGVEPASDGWLEYSVEITNRKPQAIGGFRGIVIDNKGEELDAARALSDVTKPPDYVKSAVVYAGVSAGAMLIAVPFLAPVAVGTMMYMRMKGMQGAQALNTLADRRRL